ncbi:putative mfs transporter protein [Botrytis fragariae]|uniref:Putative mfs transporter protein n=1 Tax=Botrytis fragariae TaxID=1964551 RepID=A0A8H6AV40_9HELO|nr:putative mfs transporter protein [Botrytis fragariae]KAF5873965.1 putative mfs transporter protein [Botrytis fragariae]
MTTSTETPENISTSPNSETLDEKPGSAELDAPSTTPPDEEIQISKELDQLITKKFDRHIVPWLFGLWLLAFIDRSNIGNAKIDGLAADLGILTGTKFNIALAIFYVPYICVDIPSNWLVKRIGAGYYLPALIIGWGLISLCIGFVTTWKSLLIARFFLGLMEGGLLGGIIIYLAMFYRRHQLMRRIGLFYCAAPLSGAFGGLLATGLSEIKTKGYNGWPVILVTSLSDHFKRRGLLMLICASIAIVGYIMLIATSRPHVQYGGTFLVAAGSFACPPVVMGWLANNTSPHYVRASASGLQIGLANIAAFIATFTYIAADAPRYITGHAINLGMLGLCLVVTSITMGYCKWENGKRERGERDGRLLEGNTEMLGHRHPEFRYTV